MSEQDPAQVEPPVENSEPQKRGRGRPRGSKTREVTIIPAHRGILAEMTKGKTISEAMIAMSYSKSAANKPKVVTETRSWAALMEEHLPEDLIAERHAELLNKRETRVETYGRGKNRRHEVIDLGPNVSAVGKGLEMAYKLRGAFKSEAPPPPSTAIYNLFYQPHVMARTRAFENALKESIAHEIIATDPSQYRADDQPDTADTGEPDAGETA